MKKLFLFIFLSLIAIIPLNVQALSVDKNDLTISNGNSLSIDLYANVKTETTEISFTLVYTTYDVPAYFNLEPGLTDTNPNGISHKIIFSNPVSGKVKLGTIDIKVVNNPKVNTGTITIHSGKANTNSGTIELNSQTINVTIGEETTTIEEPKEINKNLLKSIESKNVKIKLQDDVYEYSIDVLDTIEELDLNPIAKNEEYSVEISSQKIDELVDEQIIITVKDGDYTEEYKIKVNIVEDKNEEIEIDEEEFESSYKYKGKWITLIIIMTIILFIGLFLIKKK